MRRQALILIITLSSFNLIAQDRPDLQAPKSKRFIDKVELFGGASLCFNHGDMFVDNYSGDYANGNFVQNKRLTKAGYSVGVGVYHPIYNWLDITARIMWEVKGSNSELNHPLNPVNDNDREIETSEYTYTYLTFSFAPKIYFTKKRKCFLLAGGYYGKIKDERGHIIYAPQGQTPSENSFKGRYVVGFRDDGGVNKSSFAPGLSSFQKDDYGFIVGFGYSLRINERHSMSVQLIDSYGLQNIIKPVFAPFLPNPTEKNHTLSLSIGYIIKRSERNQK